MVVLVKRILFFHVKWTCIGHRLIPSRGTSIPTSKVAGTYRPWRRVLKFTFGGYKRHFLCIFLRLGQFFILLNSVLLILNHLIFRSGCLLLNWWSWARVANTIQLTKNIFLFAHYRVLAIHRSRISRQILLLFRRGSIVDVGLWSRTTHEFFFIFVERRCQRGLHIHLFRIKSLSWLPSRVRIIIISRKEATVILGLLSWVIHLVEVLLRRRTIWHLILCLTILPITYFHIRVYILTFLASYISRLHLII